MGESYDFADLVGSSYFMLEKNPWLVSHFRQIYRHILVYDYQDLTWAQHKLLHLLTGGGDEISLWAVGSDDMQLGEFRWARVDGLKRFSDDYPGAVINSGDIRAGQHPCIAWAAWRIIKKIPGRINKGKLPLPSGDVYHSRISFYEAKDPAEETAAVVERILKLLQEGKSPEEIAVVYMDKGAGKRVANSLVKLGISIRRQQMPVIKPKLVKSEAADQYNDAGLLIKTFEVVDELQPSIALLKWHQARGYSTKHLFVTGLDEDTCINMAVMPLREECFMRRQFYTALNCAEEYLHLSYSMKRVRLGTWRARRRLALLKDIELTK